MARFLAIALPLLFLLMAIFAVATAVPALGPPMDDLARRGLERREPLPLPTAAGGWLVETLALTGLFLMIQGRGGSWWLDGVMTGLVAWVFRGPILVLSVVSLSRLGSDPWWPMSLRWLLLYVVCGLTLSLVARRQGFAR